MDRLLDPAIADLQTEYADAVLRGATWRARWVLLAGYITFAKVMAIAGARDLLGSWTPAERSVMWRATLVFGVVTLVMTLVFVAPFYFRSYGASPPALLVLYVIPSVLPLAVTIGVTLAVIWSIGTAGLTSRLVAFMLAASFVWSLAMFANMAWVVPDSNQSFRKVVFREILRASGKPVLSQAPARGAREMSLSELRRQVVLRPDQARRLGFTYHTRWSFSWAPLQLAILALLTVRPRRWGRIRLTGAAFGLMFGYWVLLMMAADAERRTMLPVALIAWSPNIVFALLAVLLALRTRPYPLHPEL